MRTLGVMMLALAAAAGCDDGSAGGGAAAATDKWLVVDDAQLAQLDHDGQPWCADGTAPGAFVVVKIAGEHASTDVAKPSFAPVWNQAILEADDRSFSAGAIVEVGGECDGRRFMIGAIQAPMRDQNTFTNFGGVEWIRIYLDRTPPGATPGSSSGGGGGGGGGGDSGGGDVIVGGGSDPGWDFPTGGGDTGTGDTGTVDDGTGDTGTGDTGTVDTGTGDDGGDYTGGDDGSGDDGCSDCFDRPAHHPRAKHGASHSKQSALPRPL